MLESSNLKQHEKRNNSKTWGGKKIAEISITTRKAKEKIRKRSGETKVITMTNFSIIKRKK